MEILMDHRFEFDVEGESYEALLKEANLKARDFFDAEDYELELSAIPAPNLGDWYQAKVVASVWA
jgi:hypothetical protein